MCIRASGSVAYTTPATAVGSLADADLFTEAFLLLAGVTAVAGVVYATLPERGGTGDDGGG